MDQTLPPMVSSHFLLPTPVLHLQMRLMFRGAKWLAKDTQLGSGGIRGWTRVWCSKLLPAALPGSQGLGVTPGSAYDLGQVTSPLWASVSSSVKEEEYIRWARLSSSWSMLFCAVPLGRTHFFSLGLPTKNSPLPNNNPKSTEYWWSSPTLCSFYISLWTCTGTPATSLHVWAHTWLTASLPEAKNPLGKQR